MDFLLTDAERERFARWLEKDIESSKLIINQAKAVLDIPAVVTRMQQELVASVIVLKKLRAISSETI